MTFVQTPRLILRRFRWEDLDELAVLLADPEVMRFSVHGPYDYATVRDQALPAYIDSFDHPEGLIRLAIEVKATGRLIGFAGLARQILDDQPEIETGYRLLRDCWGHGYATEAVTAIRDYAFRNLGLKRLVAVIDPQNVRSQRVAEKIGMTFEKMAAFHGRLIRVYTISAERMMEITAGDPKSGRDGPTVR